MSNQPTGHSPNLIVHTDGGSRGNPGPAAIGFVVQDNQGRLVHHEGKTIGHATNNVAEYQAVIAALTWIGEYIHPSPDNTLNFYLDSNLVVNQINGLFKLKQPHLRGYLQQVYYLQTQYHLNVLYHHIPREQNTHADQLVNQALDAQSG